MKDYSIKETSEKERPIYVKGFEIINDEEDMKIYTKGFKATIVPNTLGNLQIVREKMKAQAKDAQKLMQDKRRKRILYKSLTIAGATCVVLINTTELGKVLNPIITNGVLSGITLLSASGTLKNCWLINDIKRYSMYLKHGKEINGAIINDSYSYANVHKKDKEKLISWIEKYNGQPLQIENVDKISFSTLKRIWHNIKMQKELGLSNQKKAYDHEFQKTKGQK